MSRVVKLPAVSDITSTRTRPTRAVAGWSQPISEITNLLAEPDHGLFKARGIALDYVPGNGGGSAIQALLAGQADVAFTDPASFYLALDKGADLNAVTSSRTEKDYGTGVLTVAGQSPLGIVEESQVANSMVAFGNCLKDRSCTRLTSLALSIAHACRTEVSADFQLDLPAVPDRPN